MTKTLKVILSNTLCQFQCLKASLQYTFATIEPVALLLCPQDSICSEVLPVEVNFCPDSNTLGVGMSVKEEIQTLPLDLIKKDWHHLLASASVSPPVI